MPLVQEGQQLTARIGLRLHPIADVRPVESGDEYAAVFQAELLHDVLAGRTVGGRRQGEARHAGIALPQHAQLLVFRPEIVAPLRDAMGLVDGEQADPAAIQNVEEPVGQKPFRRHVDEVEVPRLDAPLNGARLVIRNAGIQRRRRDSELAQRLDLVLHQRDER